MYDQFQQKFRALYYPYSRFLHETDLKRAILAFDEILFVDPLSDDVSERGAQCLVLNVQDNLRGKFRSDSETDTKLLRSLLSDSSNRDRRLPKLYDAPEVYQVLQQHGMAKLVYPQKHLAQFDQVLTFSFLRDLMASARLAATEGIDFNEHNWWHYEDISWKVSIARIPMTILQEQNYYVEMLKDVSKRVMPDLHDDERSNIQENVQYSLHSVQRSVEAHKDDTIFLDVPIAFPLILNQALLLCEELGAFPITDDPLSHISLLEKARSLDTKIDDTPRTVIVGPDVWDSYRIQAFTLGVIGKVIPDEALDAITIEEVITLREQNKESLFRFHQKMLSLSSEISSKLWESRYRKEILSIINTKVLPELQALDDELLGSLENALGSSFGNLASAVAKGAAATIPSLTLAAIMGLTSGQVVVFGAAALMSAVGVAIPDVVSYWKEKKQYQRNGLSFLLNVRKRITNTNRLISNKVR